MRIDIISAIPEMLRSPIEFSIIKRARDKGIVEIYLHNLHDYSSTKYKQIDDKPYGGGSGMVLKPEPIYQCFEKLSSKIKYDEVILTSAQGELLSQTESKRLSLMENVLIICGHYKGIDERVKELTKAKEISIGKYVLSGGELPALVIIDSIIRLIPGAIGDAESALTDSFLDSDKTEGPVYTRPKEYMGLQVPDILRSGNPKKINEWKENFINSK